MSINIELELNKRKKRKKSNKAPICIRVGWYDKETLKQSYKYRSTGGLCKIKDWDEEGKKVKKSECKHERLNSFIYELLLKSTEAKKELEEDGQLNIESLLNKITHLISTKQDKLQQYLSKPDAVAVMPAPVRYSNKIRNSDKILFAEIVSFRASYGYCKADYEYFAELYDVTRPAIRRRLQRLQEAGFIEIQEKIFTFENRIINISEDLL